MGGRARSALGGNHPAPPGRPKARAPLGGRARSALGGKFKRVVAGPGPLAPAAGVATRGPGDDELPIGDPDPDDGGGPDDDDLGDGFDDDQDPLQGAPARGTRKRDMIDSLRRITLPH